MSEDLRFRADFWARVSMAWKRRDSACFVDYFKNNESLIAKYFSNIDHTDPLNFVNCLFQGIWCENVSPIAAPKLDLWNLHGISVKFFQTRDSSFCTNSNSPSLGTVVQCWTLSLLIPSERFFDPEDDIIPCRKSNWSTTSANRSPEVDWFCSAMSRLFPKVFIFYNVLMDAI